VNFGRWLSTELIDKIKTIDIDEGQYKVRLKNRIISKSNSYWFEIISRPAQKPEYKLNEALAFAKPTEPILSHSTATKPIDTANQPQNEIEGLKQGIPA